MGRWRRGEGRMDERLMTAEQVADRLGVRRDWVYRQSRSGFLPVIRLGRYHRFRREAIEDWIRAQERATVAEPRDHRDRY